MTDPTGRYTATMLAALELWKRLGMCNPRNRWKPINDIATDCGKHGNLEPHDIDLMADAINSLWPDESLTDLFERICAWDERVGPSARDFLTTIQNECRASVEEARRRVAERGR